MAVIKRIHPSGIVYWVTFTWQKKRVWERSGKDAREARRLEKRRKAEVKAGTYRPDGVSDATTFGQWAGAWLDRRENRNATNDIASLRRYVLSREWLARMPIADLRPKHVARLVAELKETQSETTGKPLSPKSVANIYGVLRTLVRDARIDEVLLVDPCVLPRGTFRKTRKQKTPYTSEEIVVLCTDPRIALPQRVWTSIAFFTGQREGEVCGRRWCDLDRATRPLWCLRVDSQYDGRPLKTEMEGGEQPRRVPVHPTLRSVLEWWWREGWELVYGRKPTQEDYIVPTRDTTPHTKSTAYKSWRRACDRSGVTNRSLHATRHTFISLARRGGARKDVLEKITHNAKGDIVDAYTTWDWGPLCEAALCFWNVDSPVDQIAKTPVLEVEAPGIEPRPPIGLAREREVSGGSDVPRLQQESSNESGGGAECAASQPNAFISFRAKAHAWFMGAAT